MTIDILLMNLAKRACNNFVVESLSAHPIQKIYFSLIVCIFGVLLLRSHIIDL